MSHPEPGDASDRLGVAEALARRLDLPLSALGVVFLLVVLGQNLAGPRLASGLAVLGWVLWVVFVAEFGLRAYIARDQRAFWRRNWWQVIFLAVPFLRIARVARLIRLTRFARVGPVVSSAVRGSRSAGRLLGGRLGWLAVITGVVILASSQLLFILGVHANYAQALHAAALATITGEPFGSADPAAQLLDVVLGAFSVVVFATLAGALGAYFLQRPPEALRAAESLRTAEAPESRQRTAMAGNDPSAALVARLPMPSAGRDLSG